MSEPKRRKARPLLLAAASAVTLVISGCGDTITGSGNLMAPNCDMYPAGCGVQPDAGVPDLEPPLPDLSTKD